MSKPADPTATNPTMVTCASCKACCCKLEVILMGEDDPPADFIATDRWGGQVMRRLDDGWCAAVDRATMLCRIYERRPGVCRDFRMGGSECLTERLALLEPSTQHRDTENTEGTE
jgi:Fe-S-cluster containining protein